MGYMQMTLNDWLEMKQSLERELSNLKTGFIRVGYCLRRIEDSRGYEQDGYKSIAEFAKAEYGLSASTVSRFMAINQRFSLDGYSERLDPKYIGFHQSIMGEMLGLSDNDLELVTPETSRQDVRELKQFNRQEPERGIADDLRDLIVNYFRENMEELNELYNGSGTPTQEILNPSGNKVYRKGMYMMFFYTDCVKTKKFGGDTVSYTWEEFRELVDGIFGSFASSDTYSSYFEGMSLEDEPDSQAGAGPEAVETEEPESEENVRPATEIAQSATEIAQSATEIAQSDAGTAHSEQEVAQLETEEKPEEAEEQEPTQRADPEEKEQPVAEENGMKAAGSAEEKADPGEGMAAAGSTTAADTGESPMAAGAQTEDLMAEGGHFIAPAQIPMVPGQGEKQEGPKEEHAVDRGYAKAVEDAGAKLEEIRQSFERENWMKMSEQLLSLSFVVNQLKVMKKIQT